MDFDRHTQIINKLQAENAGHVLFDFLIPNIGKEIMGVASNAEIFKFGYLTVDAERNVKYNPLTDDCGNSLDNAPSIGMKSSLDDYLTLKETIEEYDAILANYRTEIKRLKEVGIELPATYSYPEAKEKKGISVQAFIAKIDGFGKFDIPELKQDETETEFGYLIRINDEKNTIQYKVKTGISFIIRCIEYQLFKENFHLLTEGIENDYQIEGKRIKWQRLPVTGTDLVIRFRDYEKKI